MSTNETEYRAHPALNWSRAKHILPPGSPKRYRWRLDNPVRPTQRMNEGTVFHTLCLEPDKADSTVCVWEGAQSLPEGSFALWEGSRRGKAWQEFEAEHAHLPILTASEVAKSNESQTRRGNVWEAFQLAYPGQLTLTPGEWDRIRRAADTTLAHPVAGRMIREAREAGLVEVPEIFECPETGMRCKRKKDGPFWDLKLTAELHRFRNVAQGFHYAGQLGWYFPDRPPFIIATSDRDETDCAVFELDSIEWAFGRKLAIEARRLVKQHTETDTWPGLFPDVEPLGLSEFYMQEMAA